MSNVTERADNDENPFRLLPEEIVIAIFNKVADLKCLCQCSLVSKHFASVIPHVRTSSLTISPIGNYSREYRRRMNKLVSELYSCSSEKIPSLLDSYDLQHTKLPNFLQKLRELEFISLDYEFPVNTANYPFPVYKIKLSCNSNKLESFVAVLPRYTVEDTDNKFAEEQYTDDTEAEVLTRVFQCLSFLEVRYLAWMCHIIILAKCHTSIQRVTITDSEFNMKLVFGDGQLVDTGLHMLKEMVNLVSYQIMLARVPVLHLPLSGYVCRYVTMVIISAPEDPLVSSNKNLAEIIDRDFEEKLMVLREAVKEIFKNHQHLFRKRQLDIIMTFPSIQ